ncbi:MAG: beta-ketoacyl-ACP synthase II [Candidatus Latescibacteria bacterium]|nr:beta-ketoacyl-ACP synthase II [Candidatus Latescibacterota bacterium]
MERRRVAITGLGLITSVGLTRDETWRAILAGTNGIAPITSFDTTDYRVNFAGEVKGFDPTVAMELKDARKADRYAQFAVCAAAEAMAQAAPGDVDPERAGVLIGSGIGGFLTFEEQHAKLLEKGPSRVSPMFIPMMIADMASGLVSIAHGFRGPNYATVSACASSGHAIGLAYEHIANGTADVMITGGSEASVCPMAMAGFSAMKALSTRNEDPAHASRPFDAERDGFVLGEGAGILVLEELERARARGATILAEVAGYGMTADAFHMTQPDNEGKGARNAMRLAVAAAGLQPADIGYINAHGTSTPFNDKIETLAIRDLFGDHARKLAVSSTKSMTGHLLGAAGGIEAAFTALALRDGKLPPTINYQNPDPECDLDYCPNAAVTRSVGAALSTSLGFGGHNVSLCLKRWPD